MRKFFSVFVMLVLLTAFCSTGLFSKVQVGELVLERAETLHPYYGKGLIYEKVFTYPEAGYIAIHFSKFDLAPGDYVEISSPDGRFYYTYRGKGKAVRSGKAVISEFWATHIPGDMAVVRLYSKNGNGGEGFVIDKWARGYEKAYIEALMIDSEPGIESICSGDDKEWAPCYEGTTMYDKAKAVCRLLIGGTSACTGWLLGSEGHVMTNNHCIDTQSEAENTDYEFMAEGDTCNTNCASWGACPGVVEASSGTLIKNDYNLDYTLILLPTNITATYGYLQFRNSLPTIGERIYIPQHPGAWGKQMAVVSDVDGPYAKIYSTDETPCIGGPGDIGYYADTAGGSSGSPVLAYNDHLVVSLHHCANCPNRGLPIPSIITHLGSDIPANAIGSITPPDPPSNLTANASACNQIDLTWQDNSGNETLFSIERSTDGSNFGEIDTVGANITSYNDTTVAENTTYWYRVRAYNSAGYSSYSNTASDTTPTCTGEPPAAPTNLQGKTRGKAKIALNWTDNSNNEDGFYIYRGLSPTGLSHYDTVGMNVTSYNDTGIQSQTTYYYKVCAYNSYGENCSGTISVTAK
jgi:hypothetical protein